MANVQVVTAVTPLTCTNFVMSVRHQLSRDVCMSECAPFTACSRSVCLLQGGCPSIQEALDMHFILSQSDTNLRQPVGLEAQLAADSGLDSVVRASMLQLLTVSPPTSFSALV